MKLYIQSSLIYVGLVTIVAAFSGLLLGYDAGIIGVSKNQITQLFNLSDVKWSLIAGSSIVGSLIGLSICGQLSIKTGSRNMIICMAIGFICGILLMYFAGGMKQFLLGRFISGLSIGIGVFMTPLFVSEIAPAKIRGGLLLINSFALTIGQSLSFLAGYLLIDTTHESWRKLVLLGLIPATFLLLGMIFTPHSPRWVAMKYGVDKTRQILHKLRGGDENIITQELEEIFFNLKENNSKPSLFKLFTKPFLHVTCIGIILGATQQFIGISNILYFGPYIFFHVGFHPVSNAILASFYMGLINLISTFAAMFLVDIVGRRALLLSGTFIAGLSLFLVGMVHLFAPSYKWLIFGFFATYIVGYCISLGSLFWVIIAEIYPQKIRGLAMSVAVTAETFASLIVTLTFLFLMNSLKLSGTFWIYSLMCLFAFIFIYFFIPETKGVSLEQIERNVNAGLGSRHLGSKTQ